MKDDHIRESMKNAGYWKIDSIHNGAKDRDLLLYSSDPYDKTEGIFVKFSEQENMLRQEKFCLVVTGRYHGAYQNIGDALFKTTQYKQLPDRREAIIYAVDKYNLDFLKQLHRIKR